MSREKLKDMLQNDTIRKELKRLDEVRSLNKMSERLHNQRPSAPKTKRSYNLKNLDLIEFTKNSALTMLIVAIMWIIIKYLII